MVKIVVFITRSKSDSFRAQSYCAWPGLRWVDAFPYPDRGRDPREIFKYIISLCSLVATHTPLWGALEIQLSADKHFSPCGEDYFLLSVRKIKDRFIYYTTEFFHFLKHTNNNIINYGVNFTTLLASRANPYITRPRPPLSTTTLKHVL